MSMRDLGDGEVDIFLISTLGRLQESCFWLLYTTNTSCYSKSISINKWSRLPCVLSPLLYFSFPSLCFFHALGSEDLIIG